MRAVEIRFKVLRYGGRLPAPQREGDAGLDIYAAEGVLIEPRQCTVVATAVASELPRGWWAKLEGRSGLAAQGIAVLGGVIDENYRGEWKVVLLNTTGMHHRIMAGDRIAQAVLHERPLIVVRQVETLNLSERGEAGFGSSGA